MKPGAEDWDFKEAIAVPARIALLLLFVVSASSDAIKADPMTHRAFGGPRQNDEPENNSVQLDVGPLAPPFSDVADPATAAALSSLVNLIGPVAALDAAKLGRHTSNPFGTIYPSHLYGIGGSAYYDTQPMATNGIYLPNSTITVQNETPYGATTTATAATFSTGSNRPGAISGYTAASQVSAYYENGATALGLNSDTQPLMWGGAGTFSATSFTPSTPITPTSSVFAAVGMWLRSDDNPPYNGQVTSWSVDGSGRIRQFIVSGWYQINNGVGSAAGTPASSYAYLNPQDKVWTFLPVLNLNSFTTTGNITSGSATITGVISTAGIVARGQFLSSGSLFPAGTYIQSFTSNTITVSKPATGTLGTATLKISAGSQMNHGAIAELDLNNNAEPFVWSRNTGSATTTFGSYMLSGVTNVASLRPYMYVLMAGVPSGAAIVAVNEGASTVTLNAKATASATVSYIATPSIEEGGTALDCASNVANANTCYLARGSQSFSFKSHGAAEAAFSVQLNGFGPVPKYGFQVDHSINATAFSAYDFGITDANGAAIWGVDSTGAQIGKSISLSAASSQVLINSTAANYRGVTFQTSGVNRIFCGLDNSSESGSNAGSNYACFRYSDAGSLLSTPFQISRQFGSVIIGTGLVISPFTTAGVVTNNASGRLSSTAGVTCSGAPTALFTTTNGVVTHC